MGTPWVQFRHYWVVINLVIGIFATVVLALHMQPTGPLGAATAEAALSAPAFGRLRVQLVADAGAALFVLVVATTLAVFNPAALTSASTPAWVRIFATVVAVLMLAFAVVHLTGHGLGSHGPVHTQFGG